MSSLDRKRTILRPLSHNELVSGVLPYLASKPPFQSKAYAGVSPGTSNHPDPEPAPTPIRCHTARYQAFFVDTGTPVNSSPQPYNQALCITKSARIPYASNLAGVRW